MRIMIFVVLSCSLLTGFSSGSTKSPEYRYSYDKSAVPKADREFQEVECELVGFRARDEYRRANPITNNWQNTGALKKQLRDRNAKNFGAKAERACLIAAGYKRVRTCIKHCN